ncbi:Hsp20 family protein [Bradyrhizobium sp. 215_C5_N1_1]|uniref:Hsp20 family protein n=1 Tax=unclassified Bradyrhizobium TaxID=2631580 RepID=UPI003F886ECE
MPPAPGAGAALCRGLRAGSRRCHRPTGQIQQPGRTQDWIKLGGKVRTSEETYPPYNIERLDENRFQISVALAGFTPDEVGLTVEQNVLTLEGHKAEKDEKSFLHRGMSTRSFKRQFTLADHVEVKGAHFENSLLVIELQREIPEAMKPRRIAIAGASAGQVKQIEGKAA